ncbi:40S ribosomal protein S24, putative [Plasmodium chabaudi chabaudi]|uniref:40S ribosomal protein S24 n=2 Tax=Plasmodium chabaudi TaxID=5825 RepID=A0A077TMM9_PLACU|nr:40S ribosomal protein S24, putative [Plasmodium chabaudi chabaudi]SCM23283.1 40S ribosomal protein S24, putative [Plasmodium chabaudi adami]SCM25233.1 40S ribosomal protein S24, putative [Plasmodium chabaudi chabaudi]SCN62347.1 40S ribosomal protein S24, putative [Plasmodium chabaudi adami]SCN62348.1 40S ribosomal protein S24, putative [Plasmodium chabaudi chabaudi]VTZ69819.1 40S ribosomal protein S24, putative [Plasmodium chabaudi chabaudi]|eukprot:XP_743291.1 40S ribosomal protein S24, putative [Plasmodium chabaudi chabaudi]
MADQFTVRVKKYMNNPLLRRKQFALEILHPNKGTISKKDVKERLAKMYKLNNVNTIVLFGFKALFGGGRTKGFGLIYNSVDAVKRFEKKYRQIREGLITKENKPGRRAAKELKNRRKKVRGTAKTKVSGGKKK